MTKRTTAQLKANWRLIALVIFIFGTGWGAKEAVSRDTADQIATVKQDMREELRALRRDVRNIYRVLSSGIRVRPMGPTDPPPPPNDAFRGAP